MQPCIYTFACISIYLYIIYLYTSGGIYTLEDIDRVFCLPPPFAPLSCQRRWSTPPSSLPPSRESVANNLPHVCCKLCAFSDRYVMHLKGPSNHNDNDNENVNDGDGDGDGDGGDGKGGQHQHQDEGDHDNDTDDEEVKEPPPPPPPPPVRKVSLW